MSFVLGRAGDGDGPVCTLGRYRALDGSDGATLHVDVDGPHAVSIVGKRGYGKSYTLGVFAEALARSPGVAPVVVDPMGAFATLAEPADGEAVPARVIDSPTVSPAALDPRSWCDLLGLDPQSGAGALVWKAAGHARSLEEMTDAIRAANAPGVDERAAINHVDLAASWGIFDEDGLDASDLGGGEATVVDVSGREAAAMNAVVRGLGETLYRARIEEAIPRLPWLLVDEAHTFFDGVANPALEAILTRGRAPGVSLVAATQRPAAVPDVCLSQSDLVVSHRLTAEADLEALERARPAYADEPLAERMPTAPGEVVVVDDATETVHAATIRRRATPHGGSSPRASDLVED